MTESFRVGIVGAGSVSDVCHAPVLNQMSDVKICWVCDKDEAKARRFATRHRISRFSSALEALEHVDAVLVAIPVGMRKETLEIAFRRRWHIFAEKPFAATLSEHDGILAAGRAAGVQVGVGLMRRFHRPTLVARELVQGMVFGTLREIWAAEGAPMRGTGHGDDWYQNDPSAAGGGVLIETGSHLIDQALFVSGADCCVLTRSELRMQERLDLDARLFATVYGRSQSDPFELRVAISRLEDLCVGLVIRFERAIVKAGLFADGGVELLNDRFKPIARIDTPMRSAFMLYQAFRLEWESFIIQCRTDTPGVMDASSARLCTALIDAAYTQRRARAEQ